MFNKKATAQVKRVTLLLAKKVNLCLFVFIILLFSRNILAEEYMTQKDFIEQNLGSESQLQSLWISKIFREKIKNDLNKSVTSARVRYWEKGEKRVWILDEIGRDKPITMGFVIQENKITTLKILAFRESRGYEVRYPRFTSQFSDLGLKERKGLKGGFYLDRSIDNITGATLSVNGVKKAAKLALYLNEQVELASSLN